MDELKTVRVPSLALNYRGRTLESVGVGGGLYVREMRAGNYMDADGEPQSPRSPEAGGGGHVSSGGLKVTFAEASPSLEAVGPSVKSSSEDGISFTDTREKLEADVRAEYYTLSDEDIAPVLRWLDRQAAITERHWMEVCGASANANIELHEQTKRVESELEAEHALCVQLEHDMEMWRDRAGDMRMERDVALKHEASAEQRLKALVGRLMERGVRVNWAEEWCNWSIELPGEAGR